jgi:hypothetical protein
VQFAAGALAIPACDFDALAEAKGDCRKRHRTGDVARVAAADGPFGVAWVRKRLWYPTPGDRLRGMLRTTFLAPSRVEREAGNLERLAGFGLQPRLLLAFGERRSKGFLLDSFLCTRALDALSLEVVLREEREPQRRRRRLAALGSFAGGLHARGFVDRDLHLRNFLAAADGALAKVDSPFGGIAPRWRRGRLQRRELDRLRAELSALSSEPELQVFESAYRRALAAGD